MNWQEKAEMMAEKTFQHGGNYEIEVDGSTIYKDTKSEFDNTIERFLDDGYELLERDENYAKLSGDNIDWSSEWEDPF